MCIDLVQVDMLQVGVVCADAVTVEIVNDTSC